MYVADDRKNRTDGDHYMFVARVLLGNSYICGTPTKYQRPPCTAPGCHKEDCNDHYQRFDSVIGTGRNDGSRLLFREFVVYDKAACYPEFLVTYVRK